MTEVMTKIKLNKLYSQDWFYIQRVLRGFIEKLDGEKGKVGRFKILKPLPTQEEFTKLMNQSYTSTAEGLLDDAFSEISELMQEVDDWKNAIEEKFSETEKFSMLEQAFDALENAENSRPDVPDVLDGLEIPVVFIERVPKMFRGRPSISRQTRLEDACGKLQAVIDALEDTDSLWKIKVEGAEEPEPTQAESEDAEDDARTAFDSEVENYKSELENIVSEIEGIEFPGMFG